MQKITLIMFLLMGTILVNAQETESASTEQNVADRLEKNVTRPIHAVKVALGGASANGDLPDSKLDLNMQLGYVRSLGSGFNLSLTYNKFNIVFEDVYNEGFMSFDLDLEYMFFPEKEFTPYVYAGPGLHAANGFEDSEVKFQFGIGMEVMVSDNVGLKLYGDRSFLGNDVLDGIEAGGGNDAYYKIGFGANFYFPISGEKKIEDDGPTFIKKNKLEDF